jgi:hypothetical protein
MAWLLRRISLGGVPWDPKVRQHIPDLFTPGVLPGGIISTSISAFSVQPVSLYFGPVDIRSLEENMGFMCLGSRTLG